eukprot:jgi/Mesen1/3765/ME000205S03028
MNKASILNIVAVEDYARLDMDRVRRTGFPEVVWGQGKTAQQIAEIMEAIASRQTFALATRVDAETAHQVLSSLPSSYYDATSHVLIHGHPESSSRPNEKGPAEPAQVLRAAMSEGTAGRLKLPGTVAVVSAGTSDLPVAEEARLTLEFMGGTTSKIADVGVAGLHRLLKQLPAIREADVVIVVAGMDGALPSVLAGVGYGAAFGGLAPLLSALNSCAPGVTVVNIDNGFGAAMAAARALRMTCKR